jgi:hypothetical protein
MSKYHRLGEFLRNQRTREVPLSFHQIEEITGVRLPPKAQNHRAWWSNNPSNNVMTKVWLRAGFESEQVDMSARRLVFRRIPGTGEADPSGSAQTASTSGASRHPLRGLLKEVTHIPPGVDLTEPADPEWADIADGDGR